MTSSSSRGSSMLIFVYMCGSSSDCLSLNTPWLSEIRNKVNMPNQVLFAYCSAVLLAKRQSQPKAAVQLKMQSLHTQVVSQDAIRASHGIQSASCVNIKSDTRDARQRPQSQHLMTFGCFASRLGSRDAFTLQERSCSQDLLVCRACTVIQD